MKIEKDLHYLVLLCVLVLIGCSSDTKTLRLEPKLIDFGNVDIGESLEMTLDITNKYGKTINITNLDLSGSLDFTITNNGSVPVVLQKNDILTVKFQFKPITDGEINGLFTIKLEEAPNKEYIVELIGVGIPVPKIEVPVTNYDLGITLINTTATQDFEIKNVGTADMEIDTLSFTGSGASTYSITAGGTTPVIIKAGVTHKITVQFAPIAVGNYSAILSISHNAKNESSPVDISLDGEGIPFTPKITVNKTSPWDIGTGSISNSKIVDLEISSTGIHGLTVSAITFTTGTEFSLYTVEDSNGSPINLPTTITVNDKITAKISFTPTALITYNDTISIIHDGVNETSPLDIAITGTGTNPVTKTFNYSGNIVNWTVPAGVTSVVIEVWGAEGSYHTTSNTNPGLGARMKGTFMVTPGETLKILVGQQFSSTGGNGGGGGSFVCKSNNDPMIVAGGGGGSSTTTDSQDKHGNITTTGGTGAASGGAGGTNGKGGSAGSSSWNAGAGGGLLTDGADGTSSGYGGKAFVNGGTGGGGSGTTGPLGGFGGGGRGSMYVVGGGGGGYSGGGGGGNNSAGVGGGGGSYNGGTNQSNAGGVNSGNGKVEITY